MVSRRLRRDDPGGHLAKTPTEVGLSGDGVNSVAGRLGDRKFGTPGQVCQSSAGVEWHKPYQDAQTAQATQPPDTHLARAAMERFEVYRVSTRGGQHPPSQEAGA